MNSTECPVILSLGSNLGDRVSLLQKAVDTLGEFSRVTKISSVYETSPVGPVPQNNFLNMTAEIRTSLTPKDLMIHLLHVEESLGRRRDTKWGPRTIDIDILFYDDLVFKEQGLIIPHERYARRRFVLEPLCEMAPDWTCPILHKTMSEICRSLNDDSLVSKTEHRIRITEEVH